MQVLISVYVNMYIYIYIYIYTYIRRYMEIRFHRLLPPHVFRIKSCLGSLARVMCLGIVLLWWILSNLMGSSLSCWTLPDLADPRLALTIVVMVAGRGGSVLCGGVDDTCAWIPNNVSYILLYRCFVCHRCMHVCTLCYAILCYSMVHCPGKFIQVWASLGWRREILLGKSRQA